MYDMILSITKGQYGIDDYELELNDAANSASDSGSQTIIFEGIIYKRGLRFSSGLKKRWVVLYDNQKFCYFSDEERKKYCNAGSLAGIESVTVGKDLVTIFHTPGSGRDWYIKFESVEAQQIWIKESAAKLQTLYADYVEKAGDKGSYNFKRRWLAVYSDRSTIRYWTDASLKYQKGHHQLDVTNIFRKGNEMVIDTPERTWHLKFKSRVEATVWYEYFTGFRHLHYNPSIIERPSKIRPSGQIVKQTFSKRSHIISEIMVTERSHVDRMKKIVCFYMKKFDSADTSPPDCVQPLFKIIPNLISIHEKFFQELSAAISNIDLGKTCLGKTWSNFVPYLKVHSLYIVQHDRNKEEISKVHEDPIFGEICPRSAAFCGEPLSSLLMEPVTRLVQYQNLLTRLVKSSSDHSDQPALKKALSKLIKINFEIDESIYDYGVRTRTHTIIREEMRESLDLGEIASIVHVATCFCDLKTPDSEIQQYKHHKCILFNECFVYQYKNFLGQYKEAGKVSFRKRDLEIIKCRGFQATVMKVGGKLFHFKFEDLDAKKIWLDKIKRFKIKGRVSRASLIQFNSDSRI